MPKVHMVSVSEARANLAALVEKVNEEQQPYHILSHSKPRAVLLAEDAYGALVEQLEDLQDAVDILTARLEGGPTRSFEEFTRELADKRGARV